MCKRVKNSAYGKDTEAKEQKWFSSLRCGPLSNPRRSDRYHKVCYNMHADMKGAAAFGLPVDSISPSCGNIAALAK